jgi:OOP family OmpA-OmpF porin
MSRIRHAAVLALPLCVSLLAACAPTSRVTLLPEADGKPSAVLVSNGTQMQSLTTPYDMVSTSPWRGLKTSTTTAEAVSEQYPQLLALRPAQAESFTLYFVPGGAELTPESAAQLPKVLASANARQGGELVITGHTDRVGSVEANDALSLQRANTVRELLISQGFKPALIETIGRGEREPLVPTADEVDEPRNRRVELLVR